MNQRDFGLVFYIYIFVCLFFILSSIPFKLTNKQTIEQTNKNQPIFKWSEYYNMIINITSLTAEFHQISDAFLSTQMPICDTRRGLRKFGRRTEKWANENNKKIIWRIGRIFTRSRCRVEKRAGPTTTRTTFLHHLSIRWLCTRNVHDAHHWRAVLSLII